MADWRRAPKGCVTPLLLVQIAVLNNEVERAKAEQNRLDQELDFLISQQNELEDLLKPLEESVKQHGTEYAQEPDREREKIYAMAGKCVGQLKGMVQDLKEIIEYLNSSNANRQQEDNPVRGAQSVKASTSDISEIVRSLRALFRKE